VWYIYVVECRDGSLYCGISKDVTARVKKHNAGTGAKYTRSRRPVKLRAFAAVSEKKSPALKAEHRFKKLHKSKKWVYIRAGMDVFLSENAVVDGHDPRIDGSAKHEGKLGSRTTPQPLEQN